MHLTYIFIKDFCSESLSAGTSLLPAQQNDHFGQP